VVGAGVGTSDVFYWESILASYIANSSAALVHPYFYLIRTNTRWSLCQLSGLSPINYSALLLECQLVQTPTNLSDGSRFVRFERKNGLHFWIDMGYGEMQSSLTAKFIAVPFLMIMMIMRVHMARMPLLRVGKVRTGKCLPSNMAINSGYEPPRLTHAMQAVKMQFIESTMRLLVVDEAKQEDVVAVERWVLMPQNTVTVNTTGTKRKHDVRRCDNQPEAPAEHPSPPPPPPPPAGMAAPLARSLAMAAAATSPASSASSASA
jgi:hypothetical protein